MPCIMLFPFDRKKSSQLKIVNVLWRKNNVPLQLWKYAYKLDS